MQFGSLNAETFVLTQMIKEANRLDKNQSSVKKPSQTQHTGPPSTLFNNVKTDTSVDSMLNLYPGDAIVTLNLTENAITEGFMCVLVASSVAGVTRRPAEKIVWLEVKNFNQDCVRLKPIVLVNIIGMRFSCEHCPWSSKFQPLQGLLPTMERPQW